MWKSVTEHEPAKKNTEEKSSRKASPLTIRS